MYPSKVQLDLWKVRAKLDRKLAKMTFEQQKKYFAGAKARLEAKTGIRLNLKTAPPPPRKRVKTGSSV